MSVPDTAKRKVLKPRQWALHESEITVYLDRIDVPGGRNGPKAGAPLRGPQVRRFNVYTEDGSLLGFIEEYSGRIDTPLGRTRLVRHGKTRTFWAVNGRDYWQYLGSQADAIRKLLEKAR